MKNNPRDECAYEFLIVIRSFGSVELRATVLVTYQSHVSILIEHLIFRIVSNRQLPVQYHNTCTYYPGHSVSVGSMSTIVFVLPVLVVMLLCYYCNIIYVLLMD